MLLALDFVLFDLYYLFFISLILAFVCIGCYYKNSYNFYSVLKILVLQALLFIFLIDFIVLNSFLFDLVPFANWDKNWVFFSSGSLLFTNKSIVYFKFIIILIALVSLLLAQESFSNVLLRRGFEFSLFVLIAAFGLRLSCSAMDLFLVVLGFDLNLLSFLAVVGLSIHSNRIAEANMKFYIYSSFISGLMLFGLSLIFSVMGSLNFFVLVNLCSFFNNAFFFENSFYFSYDLLFLALGFFFFFTGLLFKLGVFPFHFWVVDIYEVSTLPVLIFFSLAPKLVYLKVFIFWSFNVFFQLNFFIYFFFPVFAFIGFLSFIYGSVMSLYENSIRKFLAYGAISNIGLALVIFQINNLLGYVSSIFFLLVYLMTSLSIFSILFLFLKDDRFGRSLELYNIVQVSTILRSNFFLGITLACFFFSLAGLPPFPGFFSKLFLVYTLWLQGEFFYSFSIMLISVLSAVYYISWFVSSFLKIKYN